ncbi:Endonuclease/exonuclease/phosphatase [Kockiozyma suomiensis]|uniref:Endonuclease/exonuclease/phosphatase n=1 Tax=Kockiozyma suomiensis TaxID=1337062 RepID=UPI003343CC8D
MVSTNHWQNQIQLAQTSRQSSSPHHHARAAATISRGGTATASGMTDLQFSGNGSTPLLTGVSFKSYGVAHARVDSADIEGRALAAEEINDHRQDWSALDMGGQGLRNINVSLFNYQFLDKLYINHNRLTLLPGAIRKLCQLSVLDVSGNMLTSLPPEIGLLRSLRMLLIIDNNIGSLPSEMGMLYKLEVFGIEGNPLPESVKSLMAREGTRAVIVDLRDNSPAPASPAERDWIELDEDAQNHKDEVFSVVSYNILCDRYTGIYGYCPSWALTWEYRKNRLQEELLRYNADVFCLQEVDGETFEEFLTPLLKDYGGYYWPKTRVKTMGAKESKKVDGCAIFYKKTVFKLMDKQHIEYNQSALKLLWENETISKFPDIYNRISTRDNVAIVVFLEHIKTGNRLIVGNTHLHWDPLQMDVKLVQVGLLMSEMREMGNKFAKMKSEEHKNSYNSAVQIPMVVCGDYNSTVDSGVYELITQGDVKGDHNDMQGFKYGKFTADGIQHPFTLKSAYSNIGELSFTNCTPTFTESIDYIWYSANNLSVTGLLGEPDKEYMSKVIGFPNAHFTSDHISLMAEMQFKKT